MTDKPENKPSTEEGRTAKSKADHTKSAANEDTPARLKRKAERPTITDDLSGRFLRVGNKVYRTSDDKNPLVRLEPDRLKASNIDALPDILRIAKANGWTSVRINGGDKFKKAAFLAAAAQGLKVENYKPSETVRAEAERLEARIAQREKRHEGKNPNSKSSKAVNETITFKTLSDRFLKQSHEENARDPELRRAQSLVAQTISITRAKYPDDPAKASKEVEAKRQDVARRIASGDSIAAIQVRAQQAQRVREITQDHTMKKDGRTR